MSSLTDEVKGLFEPRSKLLELRREAAGVLNNDEWAAFKMTSEKLDGERRYTKRTFELEYSDRVSEAQRRLIHKAGSVKQRLVDRRFSSDPFNKQEINRQAQLEVRSRINKTWRGSMIESAMPFAPCSTARKPASKPAKNLSRISRKPLIVAQAKNNACGLGADRNRRKRERKWTKDW